MLRLHSLGLGIYGSPFSALFMTYTRQPESGQGTHVPLGLFEVISHKLCPKVGLLHSIYLIRASTLCGGPALAARRGFPATRRMGRGLLPTRPGELRATKSRGIDRIPSVRRT